MNNINSICHLRICGKTHNFVSSLLLDDDKAAVYTRELITTGSTTIITPRLANVTLDGNIIKATTYDLWGQNPLFYEINLEEDYMTPEEYEEIYKKILEIKSIIEKYEK